MGGVYIPVWHVCMYSICSGQGRGSIRSDRSRIGHKCTSSCEQAWAHELVHNIRDWMHKLVHHAQAHAHNLVHHGHPASCMMHKLVFTSSCARVCVWCMSLCVQSLILCTSSYAQAFKHELVRTSSGVQARALMHELVHTSSYVPNSTSAPL